MTQSYRVQKDSQLHLSDWLLLIFIGGDLIEKI